MSSNVFVDDLPCFGLAMTSIKMVLLLSREDGTYRILSASTTEFGKSWLLHEERVVAIIDPAEQGDYVSTASCRPHVCAKRRKKAFPQLDNRR